MKSIFAFLALFSLILTGCHMQRQEEREVSKVERKADKAEKKNIRQSQKIRDMGTQESSLAE